jgi:hypothetical protein
VKIGGKARHVIPHLDWKFYDGRICRSMLHPNHKVLAASCSCLKAAR